MQIPEPPKLPSIESLFDLPFVERVKLEYRIKAYRQTMRDITLQLLDVELSEYIKYEKALREIFNAKLGTTDANRR